MSRKQILIIDDDEDLSFIISEMLESYGYSISNDAGKTFSHRYGAKKIPTPFDEGMAYEKANGDIRMLARTTDTGELAESTSHDGGLTWDDAKDSGMVFHSLCDKTHNTSYFWPSPSSTTRISPVCGWMTIP